MEALNTPLCNYTINQNAVKEVIEQVNLTPLINNKLVLFWNYISNMGANNEIGLFEKYLLTVDLTMIVIFYGQLIVLIISISLYFLFNSRGK